MTLGGLLAIIGIMIAVYALARPAQRKSIGLFAPRRFIIIGLSISAVLLIALEIMLQWKVVCPAATFGLGTGAFLIPIGLAVWAVRSWERAKLTEDSEPRFKEFLLSCLRDSEYDEAVRILTKNRCRLGQILSRDTANVVFDRQFVRALVLARSWLHLELLMDDGVLDTLDYYRPAVYRTLRELLMAEESPLRTAAILEAGGDEMITCSEEERALIVRTFRNPQWYHRCAAGYPMVIAACERLDSGDLDGPYNRADGRYVALQGVATRSRCPVFLAEKTIAHALKDTTNTGEATEEATHGDAADLWDLFRIVYEHSRYRRETWDEPFGYGDYPTPYGFLLAEILDDYERICWEAWEASDHGAKPPPEILAPVVRMWAFCVMRPARDEGHVSPNFRMGRVRAYLRIILERRHAEVNVAKNKENRAAWTALYLDGLKEAATMRRPESEGYLRDAIAGLHPAMAHSTRESRNWLCAELGLPEV